MSTQNETDGRFDVAALAATLPAETSSMLADIYLTDRPSASARIFRVYRPVPPHYHAACDEFLYVLSGTGLFWMGDASKAAPFKTGQLLVFDRGTVHAIPVLDGGDPVIFLALDTPRRAPTDIVFVDPADGDAKTFMARNADG